MAYRAMVELLIDAPGYGEACDAVAETLRHQFKDWRYAPSYTEPGPKKCEYIPVTFTEDDKWPRLREEY